MRFGRTSLGHSAASIFTGALFAFVIGGCSPPRETTAPRSRVDPDSDRQEEPVEEAAPTGPIGAGGNQRIRSFVLAKKVLHRLYEQNRVDLYCGCAFAPDGHGGFAVDLATCGYATSREPTRAHRIEWEHAVAAATFGRSFREWTEGSERCVDRKGKRFKGRHCAETSPEFSRMEGDLHNLFPVVGEVNALRSDFPMGILDPAGAARSSAVNAPGAKDDVFTFGACKSTIERGVFLPRPEARGELARASLYMAWAYPAHLSLDTAHRELFQRWSAEDPPDEWERQRNREIARVQGNENPFIGAD